MISITYQEFKKLATYIKDNYGIHLKDEKQILVTGRLQNVLQQLGYTSFSDYYDYIIADTTGKAAATLVDRITTNHTFFMRELDHFIYFKNNVLPYWSNKIVDKDLRIWSAGCSTGEEPYTLAMLMDEYFGNAKFLWDTKILATDISGKVLDIAAKGVYNNNELENLPKNWKADYFKRMDNEKSIVTDQIKNEIIFRRFNLMEEVYPFKKKFHVIFCRNVMIYFDEITKRDLVNKFYDSLMPGGFLFIGHSESLNRATTRFKYTVPAVYRKEL